MLRKSSQKMKSLFLRLGSCAGSEMGCPLCGTNVSFYKIHFHQYWTALGGKK